MTACRLLLLLPLLACEEPTDPAAAGDRELSARIDALEARQTQDHTALEDRLTASEADRAALAARVSALEEQVDGLLATVEAQEEAQAQLSAELDATTAALAEAEARLDAIEAGGGSSAALDRLQAALSVDAAGDLALTGVNLWLRSGGGATAATPNGKGNLILGYGEALGTEARTGSHTLVVGPNHDWTGAWGIVSGESNDLFADGGALIGGTGSAVWHSNAVIAGGARAESTYPCGFRASGLQSGSGC